MSVQVKRRRETATFLSSFVGAQAELIVDTTDNRVQVHDGTTAGGWPAAKLGEVVTNTPQSLTISQQTQALANLGLSQTTAFRNIIRNGNFSINQRGVAGTVTLAAGAYGHDGWKAGASGSTYTFATGANGDTTLTVSAGTLLQIVEGAFYVKGTSYVASWSGTATGRIYQGGATGSYAASGLAATGLTAGTNTTIEFGTGTLGRAQLEPGVAPTSFEYRDDELRRCWRYYEKSYGTTVAPGSNIGGGNGAVLILGPSYYASGRLYPKRALPTMTIFDAGGTAGKVSFWNGSSWANGGECNGIGGVSDSGWQTSGGASGAAAIGFDWVASAEL